MTTNLMIGSDVIEGASFPRLFKLLATVALCAVAGTAWLAREPLLATDWPAGMVLLTLFATAMVVWHYLHILLSTTRIGSGALSQGWLWRTQVPLQDITQLRLLRIRLLDAVFAPRLMVRAKGLGRFTFHAAEPRLLARLECLAHGHTSSG